MQPQASVYAGFNAGEKRIERMRRSRTKGRGSIEAADRHKPAQHSAASTLGRKNLVVSSFIIRGVDEVDPGRFLETYPSLLLF